MTRRMRRRRKTRYGYIQSWCRCNYSPTFSPLLIPTKEEAVSESVVSVACDFSHIQLTPFGYSYKTKECAMHLYRRIFSKLDFAQ